jgi:hypothetical protein
MNTGYIFTKETATIIGNGRTEQVKRSSVEFNEVVANLRKAENATKRGDTRAANRAFDAAFAAFDKAESIRRRSKGGFQVENGVVFRNGLPVHNVITSRILDFAGTNLPFEPLFAFLKKIEDNPSNRSKSEGYTFLEHQNLPITIDGDFFAYKSVASDWFSKASGREDVEVSEDGGKTFKIYKGRIPNKVGNIVRMKRNLVDDVASRTCSHGLHVGALAYAGPNGWYNSPSDHVVLVRVNPKDIVSVPSDHQAQKLRVCEYTVVAEFGGALVSPLVEQNAVPFNAKETALYRCRECRKRKKASTFSGEANKWQTCPRCKSVNILKL